MNTDDWTRFEIGEIEVRVEYEGRSRLEPLESEFWVSVGTRRIGEVFLGKLTRPRGAEGAEGITHRRLLYDVALQTVMDIYEYSVRGNRGLRPDPLEEAFVDAARALGPAMLADARSEVMMFRRRIKKLGPKDWYPGM